MELNTLNSFNYISNTFAEIVIGHVRKGGLWFIITFYDKAFIAIHRTHTFFSFCFKFYSIKQLLNTNFSTLELILLITPFRLKQYNSQFICTKFYFKTLYNLWGYFRILLKDFSNALLLRACIM